MKKIKAKTIEYIPFPMSLWGWDLPHPCEITGDNQHNDRVFLMRQCPTLASMLVVTGWPSYADYGDILVAFDRRDDDRYLGINLNRARYAIKEELGRLGLWLFTSGKIEVKISILLHYCKAHQLNYEDVVNDKKYPLTVIDDINQWWGNDEDYLHMWGIYDDYKKLTPAKAD